MNGNDDVVVSMPYNFSIPQFLSDTDNISDTDYISDTSNSTHICKMTERLNALEKIVQKMMSMLKTINDKMCINPVPSSTVRGSVAATTRNQGQPQHLL